MADGIRLQEIRDKWLSQCGQCDAGLPMACTCPGDDYRPVIRDLVDEVERLHACLRAIRANAAQMTEVKPAVQYIRQLHADLDAVLAGADPAELAVSDGQ